MSIADWNAGIIRPVAVAPTGPYQNGTAPGMWTMDQVAYWKKQGLWPLAGNQDPANIFIENLFSTYLYTGNSSTQTINNGIDLAGKGGLVWLKGRNISTGHYLYDTNRGIANGPLSSENTNAAYTANTPKTLTSFNSNGFSMQDDSATFYSNVSPQTYTSWTFRKQPKFFDIATYTTVSGAMTIPHNLGSVPGCWIIKSTSAGSAAPDWWVFHRSIPGQLLRLNGASAVESGFSTATSTNITISNGVYGVGETLVIYLFAHDAGGFGLSGTENVVSCGSYTGNGSASGPTVNLGYEPQWVLIKGAVGDAYNWMMFDTMRGLPTGGVDARLFANAPSAENSGTDYLNVNATGFQITGNWQGTNTDGATYIYIAIRRGPMAVPTLGTTVFAPAVSSLTNTTITSGFSVDSVFTLDRSSGLDTYNRAIYDRLRGNFVDLSTASTNSQNTNGSTVSFQQNNGIRLNGGSVYANGYVYQMFRRAPSFFDEVCVTTNGYFVTASHNLGVRPELIIGKARGASGAWVVWSSSVAALDSNKTLILNTTAAATNNGMPINTVTATSFYAAIAGTSVETEVFYLFATCAGVSKVGSYTGTGTTQAIDCGFTTGARFVLIKRTDSTGDWYVWDSARGIVAGNDPYLLLNTTAAEVTGTDYVDTSPAGFEISSTAPAAINASGGSYIFLAVA